jgi:hypothetical protein
MEVSSEIQSPATLPTGKELPVPIWQVMTFSWSLQHRCRTRKALPLRYAGAYVSADM